MRRHMTRRQVLISGAKIATIVLPASLFVGCGKDDVISGPSVPPVDIEQPVTGLETRLHSELIASSKSARVGGRWTEIELNELIDSMGEDSLKRMCKTINVPPSAIADYSSNALMKKGIKESILKASRVFPGGNADEILYHQDILIPTAHNLGLDKTSLDSHDSFNLERAIYNKIFEQSWTSLNENDRINFLKASGWEIKQDKIISLAALSGAGIISGLSATVSFVGFPFYIGMSNGMSALAGSMGFTFPFTAYMGASSAIALVTSPIGLIAAAILAGAGIYAWVALDNDTDKEIMLKTVLHLHHYKVSAMQEANIALPLDNL